MADNSRQDEESRPTALLRQEAGRGGQRQGQASLLPVASLDDPFQHAGQKRGSQGDGNRHVHARRLLFGLPF